MILSELIKKILERRKKKIIHFMNNPYVVQEKLLRYLIYTAKNTVWGGKFRYSEITNYYTFKNRVPISSYEDIFPYIKKHIQGEQNVLWPARIKNFAKSSGTTNARNKYIPVSSESLYEGHFKAGKDMLTIYLNRQPDTQFFRGKNISIGGSLQHDLDSFSMICGDISALIIKNLPFWATYLQAFPMKLALMNKWEKKIEAMAKKSCKQNVVSISGVPTWIIVLLQKIIEIKKIQNLLEIWPNIELFVHGAVAFEPYRDIFYSFFPKKDFQYMEIYNASEGFFAIQDSNNSNEMLLLLDHGIFYEFIPIENIKDENPLVLSLEEVEKGKNYALVITTNSGLWRYKSEIPSDLLLFRLIE